jgi:hypothetical protein
MEEVLLNIDSRYRDITVYPQESKYKLTLEKMYKNIISARMVSMEITNTINYIDSKKDNNWFKLHLPNKINDPDGVIFQLEDGLLQVNLIDRLISDEKLCFRCNPVTNENDLRSILDNAYPCTSYEELYGLYHGNKDSFTLEKIQNDINKGYLITYED